MTPTSDAYLGRVKRIWYLMPMRAAMVQASLRIHAVSPEPPLLAHTSSESRGTFKQKPRSLAPLNGWACTVKTCHDGRREDTNSLDASHMIIDSCILEGFDTFVHLMSESSTPQGDVTFLNLDLWLPTYRRVKWLFQQDVYFLNWQ